jgi:hypothetical protein
MSYQTNIAGASFSAPFGPYDMKSISIGEPHELPNKKITFSVHLAHGGYIVEVNTAYNTTSELYIVPDDQDLGQAIGKIITHHTMSKP